MNLKKFAILGVLIFLSIVMYSGSSFPKNKENDALRVMAVTSLEKVFKDSFINERTRAGTNAEINISACRNESESFQVVILPLKDLRDVTWKVTSEIEVKNIKIQPVGYIYVEKSKMPRYIKEGPNDQGKTGWWPDPLYSTWKKIDKVKANEVQPIWVTVDVPKDLKPGNYRIAIDFFAEGTNNAKVTANLKVWDFALPDQTHLKTSFWYATYQLSEYYPEIREIWQTEKKFLKMALDNRITPINYQTEVEGNDLVRISLDPSKHIYHFDFDGMKKRLHFIFEENEKKGNLINVLDHLYSRGTNILVDNGTRRAIKSFKPLSSEFEDFTTQYLSAWKSFLMENGWSRYAYIGYLDEPGEDDYKSAKWLYPIVKKVAPEWNTVSALNYKPSLPELKDYIDIMIPGFYTAFDSSTVNYFKELEDKGREIWGYVCNKTSCIDFQGIDHRIWPWMCWKYDLKGFFYWGILNWVQDEGPAKKKEMFVKEQKNRWPYKSKWESMDIVKGAAGDGYLIYPSPEGDPWSSIRLENIRDGIEDYEYFYMLRNNLDRLKRAGKRYKSILKQGKKLLVHSMDLIKEPENYERDFRKYLAMREQLGDLIEKTSKILEERQNRKS